MQYRNYTETCLIIFTCMSSLALYFIVFGLGDEYMKSITTLGLHSNVPVQNKISDYGTHQSFVVKHLASHIGGQANVVIGAWNAEILYIY